MCMAKIDYHRTLYETKQDLARHLVKRQKLDQKIARLHALVTNLQNLCAKTDQESFEKRVDRVIKKDLKAGITQSARVILQETFFPMTPTDLLKGIEARKYNLARYVNPLAVVHTVLKRLVQNGEVREVLRADGKKTYQWVTTADKALSELEKTIPPAVQKTGGIKESK
jgi:fibronectin type 3 domain-containing protein